MNDRGAVTVGPIVWAIIVILAIIGLFAVCNGDEDELSFPVILVSAGSSPSAQAGPVGDGGASPRDHDGCWDGGCSDDWRGGGYEEDNGGYGDGRGGDGRFGGGRSGDYDGGPGDDCRNACGNTIIVPTPGEGGQR